MRKIRGMLGRMKTKIETRKMTDTPETDGEWNRLACQDHPEFERNLADFSRKMECERNQWREEAERWREMYMQFDEMLEADIKDATQKVSHVISEIEKISKEMDKGY
jgi:predicted YcjX-like family ATPase